MADAGRRVLQSALAQDAPVTLRGTMMWVLIWTALLASVPFAIAAMVSLDPPIWMAVPLFGIVGSAGIIALYAVIALVQSYFHWRGVHARFQRDDAPELREALQDGCVRATRVEAAAVVAIEEFEDEGAGFLLDVGDNRVLFLKGQEYWPIDDSMPWPNSRFDIVRTIHGNRWVGIFCDGRPLAPVDVMRPGECAEDLVWSHREEMLAGTLAEAVIRVRRAAQQADAADDAR
jgi:hypothetical protein